MNDILENDEKFIDDIDKKNYGYWEGLFDLDALLEDPILKVIDDPNVIENMEKKFKKAINIFKKKEDIIKSRLDEASFKVSNILKHSSLINIPKNKLHNIIKERIKYNNSNNNSVSSSSLNIKQNNKKNTEETIKKHIELNDKNSLEGRLKRKFQSDTYNNIIDKKCQFESNKKTSVKTQDQLNVLDVNLYKNIKNYFYTSDGYISELFKKYFRIAENTKPFLENVFPGMNMEEVLSLNMKDFLIRIYEKNMTKKFVIYWFRDYIQYFNSISNIHSDIDPNLNSNS